MTSLTIAAAIIAGGQARRLGGIDKSRLVVQGRPIIVRQVEILQRLATPIVVIAEDAARFADLGLPVYPDVVPGAGALGGILTALESVDADRVIVVAGDLPFLSVDALGHLAERALHADGAWVQTTRGIEPLLACYRRQARSGVRAAVEAREFKAADLGTRLNMAAVTESDLAPFGPVDRLLTNVNTPDDYARIE